MYSTLSSAGALFTSTVGESGGNPIRPEVLSSDLRKEMELQGEHIYKHHACL